MNIDGKQVEIFVKSGFSERNGIKKFNETVQIKSLTRRSRNLIYTCVSNYVEKIYEKYNNNEFIEYIYVQLLSLTPDDIPVNYYSYRYDTEKVIQFIKQIILQSEYSEVYDFIEGLIRYINNKIRFFLKDFENNMNEIFMNENINYRIVNHIITDVVNEEEIKSIDETLKNKYSMVAAHYAKAIELLYKTKDYDNSIKESISTVESICQILTKNDKATLGDALKLLKNDIHPAMKSAFEKLYGYTSDANGIRHANGLGEGNSTFEEAKYMLVSCSAFVNYLKENFENKED